MNFWEFAKKNWFWLLVIYTVLGLFMLTFAKNDLDAKTGLVWNAIDTGQSKLAALQMQVDAYNEEVGQIIEDITAARSDILAAQRSGDMEAALSALDQANIAVNNLVEAYPDDLSAQTLFITLMDETAGAFNRVAYARTRLINAQVSYNNNATFFFVSSLLTGGPVEVLGSNSDPSQNISVPAMGNGS